MKKITRNLFVFLMTGLTVLSVVLAFSFSSVANGDNGNITYRLSEDIKSVYARDCELVIPDCVATTNDASVTGRFKLIYPDNRYSFQKRNLLDVEGEYKIVYTFDIGSDLIEKVYIFKTVTSMSSLFTTDKYTSAEGNADSPDYFDNVYNGVKITAARAAGPVVYNRLINVSELTASLPIVEILATPTSQGVCEIGTFTVKLTDSVDENNFVVFKLAQLNDGKGYTDNEYRIWAGANKQYNVNKNTSPYLLLGYNPNIGSAWAAQRYYVGQHTKSTAKGLTANSFGVSSTQTVVPFAVMLDYESCKISYYPTGFSNVLVDLDDPVYTGFGNEWEGFPSGKAILSIEVGARSNKANYIITKVMGQSLSGESIQDTSAPIIELNYGNNNEGNLPYGVVNAAYKIFDYKITDNVDKYLYVSNIKVISPDGFELPLDNNSFTPTKAGAYSLIYSCYDYAGNLAVKEVEIQVKDGYEGQLEHVFDENMSLEGLVGKDFYIYKGNSQGGSGTADISWKVYFNESVLYENCKSFIPTQSGTYYIEYSLTDYLGAKAVQTYDVLVQENNYPYFEMPYIYDCYIVNRTYQFPRVTAKEYTRDFNGEDVEVSVYVDDVLVDVDSVKFTVSGTHAIKYKAVSKYDSGNVTEYTQTVTVISPASAETVVDNVVTRSFLTDFFVQENFNYNVTAKDITCVTSSRNNSLKFTNHVLAQEFLLYFDVVKEMNDFDSVSVFLHDMRDENVKIKISIDKAEKSAALQSIVRVNDVVVGNIKGSFYGNSQDFKLLYNANDSSLVDYTTGFKICSISNTLSGETFEGFKSGYLYFEIVLEGVKGQSGISLKQLCNQTFNNRKKDFVSPIISFNNQPAEFMRFGLNDIITVSAAKAFDVLSVNPNLELTISDPDKNVIYRGDIKSDYSFVASQYGSYTITYYAEDSSAQKTDYSVIYEVVDKIAPQLNVSFNVPNTIYAGLNAELGSFSVSDNVSKGNNIYVSVTVYDPEMQKYSYSGGNYAFNKVGTYTVVYYAVDEAGNFSMQTFEVTAIRR